MVHVLTVLITYVILFSILGVNCLKKDNARICYQLDDCQCSFRYGLGINLNQLKVEYKNKTLEVIFHPCSNIKVENRNGTNECAEGTSLCIIKLETINLGKADSFEFTTTRDGSQIGLLSSYNSWTTFIRLECGSVNETDEIELNSIDYTDKNVDMTLKSSKACLTSNFAPLKIPTWTIVFLVVCTIIVVYCVGGALLSKFLFGNEGPEIIPNYSFWNNAFSRVKNACTSCCDSSSGYDRI